MTHIPTVIDVKTDMRRAVYASFSTKEFADENFKTFMIKAEKNLQSIKNKIGARTYSEVTFRIEKSKNPKVPLIKRREDLLTASCLI